MLPIVLTIIIADYAFEIKLKETSTFDISRKIYLGLDKDNPLQ